MKTEFSQWLNANYEVLTATAFGVSFAAMIIGTLCMGNW